MASPPGQVLCAAPSIPLGFVLFLPAAHRTSLFQPSASSQGGPTQTLPLLTIQVILYLYLCSYYHFHSRSFCSCWDSLVLHPAHPPLC